LSNGFGAGLTEPSVEAAEVPVADERGPERTCIVTRRSATKEQLLRFVVGPDGSVVPDIRAKLPGRGAWVWADAATLALAVKRKAFQRAFKKDVTVSPDLVALVDRLLAEDALQALSFANKAGLVTSGTTKAEAAIAAKPVVGLIHAAEAGEDGRKKLGAAMWRRWGEQARTIPRIQIFTSAELDLALGRPHVVHASLTTGALSVGFIARSARLECFRGQEPPKAVGETAEPRSTA
jgi:predicted RNA-binding protein YlxR (DUF448 family)